MSEDRARLYTKQPLLSVGALSQMYWGWGQEILEELQSIEKLAHTEPTKIHIGNLPIYTKPILEKWIHCDGRVILIGDAAHAYGPGGHGVTMALQDARELVQVLTTKYESEKDQQSAWDAFQVTRREDARRHGVAADHRNKSHLVRSPGFKVWLTGLVISITATVFKWLHWRLAFINSE